MPDQRYFTYTDETGVTFKNIVMPMLGVGAPICYALYRVAGVDEQGKSYISPPNRTINELELDWCGFEFEALPNNVIKSTGGVLGAVDEMHSTQINELENNVSYVSTNIATYYAEPLTEISNSIDEITYNLEGFPTKDLHGEVVTMTTKMEQLNERIKSLEKYRF